jgi:hypothetical protein
MYAHTSAYERAWICAYICPREERKARAHQQEALVIAATQASNQLRRLLRTEPKTPSLSGAESLEVERSEGEVKQGCHERVLIGGGGARTARLRGEGGARRRSAPSSAGSLRVVADSRECFLGIILPYIFECGVLIRVRNRWFCDAGNVHLRGCCGATIPCSRC